MEVHNCPNYHYGCNLEPQYLELHESFCKLSLYIHHFKNPTLLYGDLEFERWTSKLLLSINKIFNKKNPKFKVKKKLAIKIFPKTFAWYQCHHIILSLNAYSLIIDYYKVFGIILNVHNVMTIQKLFKVKAWLGGSKVAFKNLNFKLL